MGRIEPGPASEEHSCSSLGAHRREDLIAFQSPSSLLASTKRLLTSHPLFPLSMKSRLLESDTSRLEMGGGGSALLRLGSVPMAVSFYNLPSLETSQRGPLSDPGRLAVSILPDQSPTTALAAPRDFRSSVFFVT